MLKLSRVELEENKGQRVETTELSARIRRRLASLQKYFDKRTKRLVSRETKEIRVLSLSEHQLYSSNNNHATI